MNRTARSLAIGLSLGWAGVGVAAGGESPQASHYFVVRASARVVSVPFDAISRRPDAYRSCLVEIRGTVTGNARRVDGAMFVVTGPTCGTYMVEAAGEAAQEAIAAGQTVRVLARVPDGIGVSHLLLAAVVSEYDAESYESEQARHPSVAVRPQRRAMSRSRPARRRVLASRGGTVVRATSILEQYAQAVIYFNRGLSWDEALRIAQSILVYSRDYGLDARLVMAVIAVESNFNANAVSSKGAMGLGQLMPGTAAGLGVGDPWSPEQNIEGATRLLSGHLSRFAAAAPTEEAIKLALACYNAGAGAVRKHNGVPPYRETQAYIRKVTRLYYEMCGQPPP